MTTFTDEYVQHEDRRLRVRDHHGTGSPVLLVHGAGADLESWDPIAAGLAARHHVVAVDQRGHGRSDPAPWSLAAVTDDLEAVVAALGLNRPAVVGHSVGGLVAGRWATRHADCPAAVSLDGHRTAGTEPRHLDPAGQDLPELDDLAQRFTTWFEGMFANLDLTHEQAVAAAEARAAIRTDDLDSLRGVRSPFLLVVAEQSGPFLPAEFEPLMVAFRAGLHRDLRTLTAANPALHVQPIEASHGLLTEKPQEGVAQIEAFLDQADGTPIAG